tara:strand:- start:467 stop:2155 length:1689 start_codon:yes stop_codon:yes gene_type:complete
MEFAIPILAIGGWYASCENKQPSNPKEDFSNRTTNDECGISSYAKPTCNKPCNDNTTGANHFYGTTNIPNTNTQFESLTGKYMNSDDIQHNNMTPFFGSKTRGNAFVNDQSSDSTLDTMQGKGSEMIKKQEQAPLFKPQENMQWTHGMPNQGDFMRSRMNAPNSMNNVKPWQEVQVGPGINQGYDNNNGSGGFNSGMEHRDLYLPKNVNELRTTTNPKITYSLDDRQGPAHSEIKKLGSLGQVEKYTPDTFYKNGPERYLTTTGAYVKPGMDENYLAPNINRNTDPTNYVGAAGTSNKELVSGKYLPPHKQQLANRKMVDLHSNQKAHIDDHGQSGIHYNTNNRSVINSDREGNASSLVDAMISPVMDFLRPGKKTNFIGNIRPNGNIQNENGTYRAPTDRIAPTTRDTTLYDPMALGAMPNGVAASKHASTMRPLDPIDNNQRSTTNYSVLGGASSGVGNMTSYEAGYNMDVKNDKTQSGQILQGGMNLYQGNINQDCSRQELPAQRVERGFSNNVGPNMTTMGKMKTPQTYEQPNQSRMDPNLLAAFKNNPYTHSLSSAV